MAFEVKGVHPIVAPEPCWLLEMWVDPPREIDWNSVTQEDPDRMRQDWQVAWAERPLDSGLQRWAFFFHFLDISRPLLTQEGPVRLPNPSPLPNHLTEIQYVAP